MTPALILAGLLACTPSVQDTAGVGDSGSPLPTGGTIVATSSTEALAAGRDILDEGGNAVDAALAVAMMQIVRTGGSWNSFAGIMGMVVYDAESGEVTALHGDFGTFAAETDPSTIPADAPSGRTALVPGFMAAAETAHDRYGNLPLSRVMEPAITLADEGFEVDALLEYYIEWRQDVLDRRDDTRAIFTDADGQWLQEGDLFQQAALADTLRHVATDGAAWMYSGAWADHFVAAVSEEGGAAQAADLTSYSADWLEPLRTDYAGHEVFTLGERELGSVQIVEALNMADAAGLAELGAWTESGEALYWVTRITQANALLTWLYDYLPQYGSYLEDGLPGVQLDHAARVDPANAALLVGYIADGTWAELIDSLGLTAQAARSHSDAIVVVDAQGNAVALTHSINTTIWGGTGIFVDGVSIPDAASFQQDLLTQVTPGDPLPTPLNPLIALQDGQPVLAASTIGNVHYAQFQRSHAVLGLGRSPEEALAMPMVAGMPFDESVQPGSFDAAVLEEAAALGTPISVSNDDYSPAWAGLGRTDTTWTGGVEAWLEQVGGGSVTTE